MSDTRGFYLMVFGNYGGKPPPRHKRYLVTVANSEEMDMTGFPGDSKSHPKTVSVIQFRGYGASLDQALGKARREWTKTLRESGTTQTKLMVADKLRSEKENT